METLILLIVTMQKIEATNEKIKGKSLYT